MGVSGEEGEGVRRGTGEALSQSFNYCACLLCVFFFIRAHSVVDVEVIRL